MRVCSERRTATILLILFGLNTITGCDRFAPEKRGVGSTRVFVDDLSREVKLPERISRAISLAPSVTEMIFAASAGDKLVGVTTYCNYPEPATAIEKVGDTQTPNIERIIALKPDVVFISKASQLEAFMQTLEQQNIAVYVTDPKNVEAVIDDLRTLGRIFGTEEQNGLLADGLKRRAEAVNEKVIGRARPNVFVQISNEPLFTVGKDSFLLEIIERAGGDLVTKDVPTAFPKLSKETASAMSPDVIILSDSEDNREPNVVFKNAPAVKMGRVYRVNADILSRPGPRLVDALEEISHHLHP
jgi:ABC-type Fe3+-hydroxamate transport system substrate-binding protein